MNKFSKNQLRDIGLQARSDAPLVVGNCDFISKKMVRNINKLFERDMRDFCSLEVVNVVDSEGRRYTHGHTIVKLDGELVEDNDQSVVYVDPSLDQFCDSNREQIDMINISFGSESEIETVRIVDQNEAQSLYEFRGQNIPV